MNTQPQEVLICIISHKTLYNPNSLSTKGIFHSPMDEKYSKNVGRKKFAGKLQGIPNSPWLIFPLIFNGNLPGVCAISESMGQVHSFLIWSVHAAYRTIVSRRARAFFTYFLLNMWSLETETTKLSN